MTIFLIRDNNADSWTGSARIWPRAFASAQAARDAIVARAPYWKDPERPLHPYWTILEVELEGAGSSPDAAGSPVEEMADGNA